jgi:hypothetical protein
VSGHRVTSGSNPSYISSFPIFSFLIRPPSRPCPSRHVFSPLFAAVVAGARVSAAPCPLRRAAPHLHRAAPPRFARAAPLAPPVALASAAVCRAVLAPSPPSVQPPVSRAHSHLRHLRPAFALPRDRRRSWSSRCPNPNPRVRVATSPSFVVELSSSRDIFFASARPAISGSLAN